MNQTVSQLAANKYIYKKPDRRNNEQKNYRIDASESNFVVIYFYP